MKQFGYAILALGIVALLATLSMDTSVPSGTFERVNNIGLMQEKQNFLIVSALIVLIGVVMIAVSYKATVPEQGYGKGRKFALILAWGIVVLAAGQFVYTLTPQYQEQKAELEKLQVKLRDLMEKERILNQD